MKIKRFKRNRHLCVPTCYMNFGTTLPNPVPVFVHDRAILTEQSIPFGSPWIDLKPVRIAPIEKCIEDDDNFVLIWQGGIASDLLGRDLFWMIVTDKTKIKIVFIVADVDHRFFRNRRARIGLPLNKLRNNCRFLPACFIDFAVNFRWRLHFNRFNS